jgi:hypothetical protein
VFGVGALGQGEAVGEVEPSTTWTRHFKVCAARRTSWTRDRRSPPPRALVPGVALVSPSVGCVTTGTTLFGPPRRYPPGTRPCPWRACAGTTCARA